MKLLVSVDYQEDPFDGVKTAYFYCPTREHAHVRVQEFRDGLVVSTVHLEPEPHRNPTVFLAPDVLRLEVTPLDPALFPETPDETVEDKLKTLFGDAAQIVQIEPEEQEKQAKLPETKKKKKKEYVN